jgi:hypothetical protein
VHNIWYSDAALAPPWPVGTASPNVADRWDMEPPAATTNGAGRGGFRAPDLPNDAAPNELRLFGR